MENNENNENQPARDNKDRDDIHFETRKIYLKDASFETPSTPNVFIQPAITPKLEVQVLIEHRVLDEKQGMMEIVLKTNVTSEHEDNILYLAEVHQAGLFQIRHPDSDTRQVVIEVTCPHILLPFAREELNSLISKGGFSSFLLAPVNFESMFRQKKENAMNQAANTATSKYMN